MAERLFKANSTLGVPLKNLNSSVSCKGNHFTLLKSVMEMSEAVLFDGCMNRGSSMGHPPGI